MAWSTDLFCNISFSRETFNTIEEVYNRIDELKACLETAKDRIRGLVIITEPNKFCNEEDDVLYWLSSEFKDNMKLVEEYTIELYKLNLLCENWTACHTVEGLAIDRPDNVPSNAAYLSGDFIRSVKYPNGNE